MKQKQWQDCKVGDYVKDFIKVPDEENRIALPVVDYKTAAWFDDAPPSEPPSHDIMVFEREAKRPSLWVRIE